MALPINKSTDEIPPFAMNGIPIQERNGDSSFDVNSLQQDASEVLDNSTEQSEESTQRLLSTALTPLFWAGLAALFFLLLDSILFYPIPHSIIRVASISSLVVVVIIFRRFTKNPHTPVAKASYLRLIPLLGAMLLAAAMHLWNPGLEMARGMVMLPLLAAAQFRSIKVCLGSNVLYAIIWAVVWHYSGLPFTHTDVLYHLILVPIFSYAIFICHDLSIGHMFALHRFQQQHNREQQSAIQLVMKESAKRAEAEEELRHANHAINEFLHRVPVACFRRTKEKILFMSSAYERIWGRPVEELYENPAAFFESVHPEDQSRLADVYLKYLAGEGCECEYRIIRPDGEIRWIRCDTHTVRDEETGTEYDVGVAHDVTIKKEAEERFKQQELLLLHSSRLSSTGELVAGIAHEVNQPLYAIVNYAKAVENTLENTSPTDIASIHMLIRKIRDEATRGGKITHRLKSFVKKADAEREITDLRNVIRESIDFTAMEARHGVVEVVSKLDDELPLVSVDRIQIQQVLVNLIKNAIEAFDQHNLNPRSVVISALPTEKGVEVSVADNGIGLPKDLEANILDPFQTTKAEGIGLGLAISNTIIEAHHSELTYETNDWGGATFRFELAGSKCLELVDDR